MERTRPSTAQIRLRHDITSYDPRAERRPALCYAFRMRWSFVALAMLAACSSSAESPIDPPTETGAWDATPLEAEPELRAPTDAGCPWLENVGAAVETGAPMQAWCLAGTTNAAECPASAPEPGSACAPERLTCRYALEATYARVSTCAKGKWLDQAIRCASACAPKSGGTYSLGGAACGSAPDIACADNDHFTDYERAAMRLRAFVECCGGLNENSMVVRLVDGCATSIELARSDLYAERLAGCLTKRLAGRRLLCATSACVELEWSTLK